MKFLGTVVSVLPVLFAISLANAADATITADKGAVNGACTQEASTAGCGSDAVGTGLLKCIHAYKKAHKGAFTISPGCETAMKQLHTDKKAGK